MNKIILAAFIASVSFAQAQAQSGRDTKEVFEVSPGPVNEKPARGNPKAVVISNDGEPLNINEATSGSYEVNQEGTVVGHLVIQPNGEMLVVPVKKAEKTPEKSKVESRFQKRE